MSNVINLAKAKRERDIEKFGEFKSEFKREVGVEPPDFKEHMARIRRSLEAINHLMKEIKSEDSK